MAIGGIGQLASRVNVQNTIGLATYIYRSVENGVVRYVGITYNFSARAATHLREKGIQVTKLFEEGLSREEARAVEQVLIELHGLSGNGSLMNQINSIAASNPIYAESIRRGTEILRAIGYPGL
jgi:filamentous hemagglutinin